MGDEDIDYAYGVFKALEEAMDKIAAEPRISTKLVINLIQKMPELFDVVTIITVPEHRPVVGRLVGFCETINKTYQKYQVDGSSEGDSRKVVRC